MGWSAKTNLDMKEVCRIINACVPIPYFLEILGYSYAEPYGKVFCPFHKNTDTEAAAVLHLPKGDRLHCFAEGKWYSPYDFVATGLISKTKAVELANKIRAVLTDEQLVAVLKGQNVQSPVSNKYVGSSGESWSSEGATQKKFNDYEQGVLDLLREFKQGKLTFMQLRKAVYKLEEIPTEKKTGEPYKYTPTQLWDMGRSDRAILKKLQPTKYTLLFDKYNGSLKWRWFYYNDIKDLPNFPKYLKLWLKDEKLCWAMRTTNGVSLRSANPNSKDKHRKYGANPRLYGFDSLDSDWVYGKAPIVVVEGVADRDAISKYYGNTLGAMTNSLGAFGVAALSYLTDKVILAYDMDKAGLDGAEKDTALLSRLGIKTYRYVWSGGGKDMGEWMDMALAGKTKEVQKLVANFIKFIDGVKEE